ANGFEKSVIGSTAERILHHVSCPVLVVGPECLARTFQMGSILLCTNLTPGSYRPAQYATSLAQEHNASLIIVHAVPNHRYVLNTLLRSELRMKVRELLPADIERWCHLKIVIVRGEAADSILPIAQREKASLIVAGISDEGVLADHLPWRTLTSLIRQAKCPILAVRGHLAK